MSTHPVFTGEHAASGTLFRAHQAAQTTIQVLRDGREVARYGGHLNSPVSLSRDGLLCFRDGYGRLKVVDLAGPLPAEARVVGEVGHNATLHPDGRRVLLYAPRSRPHRDADGGAPERARAGLAGETRSGSADERSSREAGERSRRTHHTDGGQHAGLVEVDLAIGAARTVWDGSTAVDHATAVKERPPTSDPKADALLRAVFGAAGPDQPLPFADVALAPDGEHWALLDAHRIVLGRGGERLGAAGWQDEQLYPPNVAWDLEGGRVYVTGRPGIFSFSLRGEPLARWAGAWPREVVRRGKTRTVNEPAPVTGPALRHGDDLLAVVRAREVLDRYGDRSTYAVFRFDPATLAPRGRLEGLPERRLPGGDSALLPMEDGGLAWVPREAPLLVLPGGAGERSRRSTPLVHVVGDDAPPRLPPPDAAWYDAAVGSTGLLAGDLMAATPDARRSLARFLLEELQPDGRFDALLDLDPDAFLPWADAVLAWDDEALRRLAALSRARWRVARGASDAAVDALAARLEARVPDADELRLPLLAGACTARALERAAALARRSPATRLLLRDHLLDVPDEGPAVPRYVQAYEELVARKEAGDLAPLPVDVPPDAVLAEARAWSCAAPPRHITSLPLDRLAGDPLRASPLRSQPLLLSSCEACDEAIGGSYVLRAAGDRVALVGVLDGRERPDAGCEGEPADPAPKVLTLEPPREERPWPAKVVGRLGGLPRWWQHPEVPDCPACGRLMFYVGWLAAGDARDDLAGAGLFAFHCEACGVAAQVVQVT